MIRISYQKVECTTKSNRVESRLRLGTIYSGGGANRDIFSPIQVAHHIPFATSHRNKMVCSKCQKKLKSTELATPGVKRKNDMYYGSPSSSLGGGADKGKAKATLGATGIGKV